MPRNIYDTAVATYARDFLQPAIGGTEFVMMHVSLAVSTTYAKGTPIAESNATKGLFAPAGTAGYGSSVAVLPVACSTNSDGDILVESPKKVDPTRDRTIEAVFGGYVRAQDIPGLDATIAGHLGKLVRGTVTNGIVYIR
jgi:hypothetical protein